MSVVLRRYFIFDIFFFFFLATFGNIFQSLQISVKLREDLYILKKKLQKSVQVSCYFSAIAMGSTSFAFENNSSKSFPVAYKGYVSLPEPSNVLTTLHRVECLRATCHYLLRLQDEIQPCKLSGISSRSCLDGGATASKLTTRSASACAYTDTVPTFPSTVSISVHETVSRLHQEVNRQNIVMHQLFLSSSQAKKRKELIPVSCKRKGTHRKCNWEPTYGWKCQNSCPLSEMNRITRDGVFSLESYLLCGEMKKGAVFLARCFHSFLRCSIFVSDHERLYCRQLHYHLLLLSLHEKTYLDQVWQRIQKSARSGADLNICRAVYRVNSFRHSASSSSLLSAEEAGKVFSSKSQQNEVDKFARRNSRVSTTKFIRKAYQSFLFFVERQMSRDEEMKKMAQNGDVLHFLGGSFWHRLLEYIMVRINWMKAYFPLKDNTSIDVEIGETGPFQSEAKLLAVRNIYVLLEKTIRDAQCMEEIEKKDTLYDKNEPAMSWDLACKSKVALLLTMTSVILEEAVLFLLYFQSIEESKKGELEIPGNTRETKELGLQPSISIKKEDGYHWNNPKTFYDFAGGDETSYLEFSSLKPLLWAPSMMSVMSHAFCELTEESVTSFSDKPLYGRRNDHTVRKQRRTSGDHLQQFIMAVNSWKKIGSGFSEDNTALHNRSSFGEPMTARSTNLPLPSELQKPQKQEVEPEREQQDTFRAFSFDLPYHCPPSSAMKERKVFQIRCLHDMCSYFPGLLDGEENGEIKVQEKILSKDTSQENLAGSAENDTKNREMEANNDIVDFYFFDFFISKIYVVLQQCFTDIAECSSASLPFHSSLRETSTTTNDKRMMLNVARPKLLILLYHTLIPVEMTHEMPIKGNVTPRRSLPMEGNIAPLSSVCSQRAHNAPVFQSVYLHLYSSISAALFRWMKYSVAYATSMTEELVETVRPKNLDFEGWKEGIENSCERLDIKISKGQNLEAPVGSRMGHEWLENADHQLVGLNGKEGREGSHFSPVSRQLGVVSSDNAAKEGHGYSNMLSCDEKQLLSCNSARDPSRLRRCGPWSRAFSLVEFYISQTKCMMKKNKSLVGEGNSEVRWASKNTKIVPSTSFESDANITEHALNLSLSSAWECLLEMWSQACELSQLLPELLKPFSPCSSLGDEQIHNNHLHSEFHLHCSDECSTGSFSHTLKKLLVNWVSHTSRILLDDVKCWVEKKKEEDTSPGSFSLLSTGSNQSWYAMLKASEAYDTSVALHSFIFMCDELSASIHRGRMPGSVSSSVSLPPSKRGRSDNTKSDPWLEDSEVLSTLLTLRGELCGSISFLRDIVWIPTMAVAIRSVVLECILGEKYYDLMVAEHLLTTPAEGVFANPQEGRRSCIPGVQEGIRAQDSVNPSSLSFPRVLQSVAQELNSTAVLSEHLRRCVASSSTCSVPPSYFLPSFSSPSFSLSPQKSVEQVKVRPGVWMLASELGYMLQLHEQWFSSSFLPDSPLVSFPPSEEPTLREKHSSAGGSLLDADIGYLASFLLRSSFRPWSSEREGSQGNARLRPCIPAMHHLLHTDIPSKKVVSLFTEEEGEGEEGEYFHQGTWRESASPHSKPSLSFTHHRPRNEASSAERESLVERWRSYMLKSLVYPLIEKWSVELIKQSVSVLSEVLWHDLSARQQLNLSPLSSFRVPPSPSLSHPIPKPPEPQDFPESSTSSLSTTNIVDVKNFAIPDTLYSCLLFDKVNAQKNGSELDRDKEKTDVNTTQDEGEWFPQVLLELHFIQGVCYIIGAYVLDSLKSLCEGDSKPTKDGNHICSWSTKGDKREEEWGMAQSHAEGPQHSLVAALAYWDSFFGNTQRSFPIETIIHLSTWNSIRSHVAELAWYKVVESSSSLGLPLHGCSFPFGSPLLSSGSVTEEVDYNKNIPVNSPSDSFLSHTGRSLPNNEGVEHFYRQVPRFLPLPIAVPASPAHTSSLTCVANTILDGKAHGASKTHRSLMSIGGVAGGMREALGRLAHGRDGKDRSSSVLEKATSKLEEKNLASRGYRIIQSVASNALGGKSPAVAPDSTGSSLSSSAGSEGWKHTASLSSTLQFTFDKINPIINHSPSSGVSKTEGSSEDNKRVAISNGGRSASPSEIPNGALSTTSGNSSSHRAEGAGSMLTNVWSSLWNPA